MDNSLHYLLMADHFLSRIKDDPEHVTEESE